MRIFQLELLSDAISDINESYYWYEDRAPGLGDRFRNAITQSFLLISQNPEFYPQKRKNYREAPLKGFPFIVIYKILEKNSTVLVTDVFHTKRNPRLKYKRR